MEAKLYGQNKGGMSINGIIKDYYAYAGENISAGDLVEYVNGIAGKVDYGESVDTQLSTEVKTGQVISAVALDNNRVFIAHSYGSDAHLYGVVCTINGATITCGADTVINNTVNSGFAISAVALDKNRVFIAHSYNSSYLHLYGIVCTINGATITCGADSQLTSGDYKGRNISALLLSNGNVFIAHSDGSSNSLSAMICTISGTTIKKGTDTSLVTGGNIANTLSTVLLPNGNVFIAHTQSTSRYLWGIVCSIDETTITKGTDTSILQKDYAGGIISTCLLPNGNVFIAHRYNSDYHLSGIVCSISGTTITKGSDTAILTSGACHSVSTHLLANGDVFIVCGANYGYYLYGIICSVDGTTITKVNEASLIATDDSINKTISSALMSNGIIFIAHCNTESTYYLNAQIFTINDNNVPTNQISITEYETQVRKVTTGQFDGVAKTSGEGSPEFVEGEVKKTGNIFPSTPYWTGNDTYTQFSAGGYTIEGSSTDSTDYAYLSVDGNGDTDWTPVAGLEHWLKMICPEPQKITKMNIVLGIDSSNCKSLIIQGSNDNNIWDDLRIISKNELASLGETTLNNIVITNPDFYKYYRIYGTHTQTGAFYVDEWQTSEYIEKGLVPSTGHKDLVSIWTLMPIVTQEMTMADGNTLADANGDIFLVREA